MMQTILVNRTKLAPPYLDVAINEHLRSLFKAGYPVIDIKLGPDYALIIYDNPLIKKID